MTDLHKKTYQVIESQRSELAEVIVSAQFERHPELVDDSLRRLRAVGQRRDLKSYLRD